MIGTIVNATTVLIGSSIGLLINKSLPENLTRIVFQGIGLFTLYLGFSMALKGHNILIIIFSIIIGAIIGELLNIDRGINNLSEKIKKGFKSENEKFAEGLITAFLLFCMGSMTILGAINEGLRNDPSLLFTKALMDGFASLALASSMGIGVLFSVIPLLIYQGGLTLFAGIFQKLFTPVIVDELTAVGGILLIGLGLSILEIKKIKIINIIPALIIIVIFAYFFK